MKIRSSLVGAGALLLLAAAPAAAQSETGSGGTTVQVTPYVWATGFGGTLRPGLGAPTVHVDKSFGELMEDVDAAFFVSGLIKHDRLVIVADLTHSSSSREGLVPTGNPALPFVPAQGKLSQTSATALVGYRAVEQEGASLDVLVGGRAWWIRPKAAVPALNLSASAKASFVDPVFATRLNIKASPSLTFLLYGDIGGFGAASEVTGQAAATANLRVTKNIWLSGGYRYLYVDYKSGNVRTNAALAGPLLGATVTF
ncbi:MAG: hypothetical protein JHD35_03100 [Sphingopyxis sp.]|nr:hypothetical protein [Sphingopyxis sp.]